VNFLDRFSKNTQISNFKEIRPVAPELFYANKWTDRYNELDVFLTVHHELTIY